MKIYEEIRQWAKTVFFFVKYNVINHSNIFYDEKSIISGNHAKLFEKQSSESANFIANYRW